MPSVEPNQKEDIGIGSLGNAVSIDARRHTSKAKVGM